MLVLQSHLLVTSRRVDTGDELSRLDAPGRVRLFLVVVAAVICKGLRRRMLPVLVARKCTVVVLSELVLSN